MFFIHLMNWIIKLTIQLANTLKVWQTSIALNKIWHKVFWNLALWIWCEYPAQFCPLIFNAYLQTKFSKFLDFEMLKMSHLVIIWVHCSITYCKIHIVTLIPCIFTYLEML